jgi:hypothetical protein
MDQFNLEDQYQVYLQRVMLHEQKMEETQKIETKRAFMGACGQMLVLLTEGTDNLTEQQALPLLAGLFTQVSEFWNSQTINVKALIPLVKMPEEHFDEVFPGIHGMYQQVIPTFNSLFGLHQAIAKYGDFDSYSKLVELSYDVEFKYDRL